MFRNTIKEPSRGREKLRKFRKASLECIMCILCVAICNLQWVMKWTTVKRFLTVFKNHDRRTAVQKLSLLADPYTVRTRYQRVMNVSLLHLADELVTKLFCVADCCDDNSVDTLLQSCVTIRSSLSTRTVTVLSLCHVFSFFMATRQLMILLITP